MAINERQLALYNYLLNQKGWVKRIDILRDLAKDYKYVDYGDLYHNASAVLLTKDLHALNNSSEINKLIIHSSKHGVKIASEEEASLFLRKDLAEALKKLQQHHFLQDKLLKNGQIFIVGNDVKVVETFRR